MKKAICISVFWALLGSALTVSAEDQTVEIQEPRERLYLPEANPFRESLFTRPLETTGPGAIAGGERRGPALFSGRSSIWISAGSHGHLGLGFSTLQPFEIGEIPFYYGLTLYREQGRDWFSGLDFTSHVISPSVEWHGDRTSVRVGVTVAESTFSGTPRPTRLMSPGLFRDGVRFGESVEVDNRLSTRGVQVGVQHRLFENLDISVGVQKDAHSVRPR